MLEDWFGTSDGLRVWNQTGQLSVGSVESVNTYIGKADGGIRPAEYPTDSSSRLNALDKIVVDLFSQRRYISCRALLNYVHIPSSSLGDRPVTGATSICQPKMYTTL